MSLSSPHSAALSAFFAPNGVAVIGASRDPSKLGYGVMRNLTDPEHGYPGPVYPVNPKSDEVLGRRCYPDIGAVPNPVELAIIVVPAPIVPQTIDACGRRGVRAAVVITGGFREIGPEGAALEQQMVEIARRYGLRIMGPNGIGVIDTYTPLNTTFVGGMPPRGHIGFLSQSGALCGGMIDWTIGRGIGFSRLLSVGNEADVNETEMLPLLAGDDATRVIALYLEDVKGGPAFVDELRLASRRKPVLALKAGRTSGGQAATASHTGALAGAHAAFQAVCHQAGVVEVTTVKDLFNSALALAYQPLPAGNRIAIVTNAGGPAALAADALEGAGLQLVRTSPAVQQSLRSFLPANAQVAGPVDLLGGADENTYRRTLDLVIADPACDGVLAILVPQSLVDPVAVVEAFAAAAAGQAQPRKPILACLMGEASLDEAHRTAHTHQIPAYTFPEETVAAFGALYQRARWVARSVAVPQPPTDIDAALARFLLTEALRSGARALDATTARQVLAAYGIPVVPDLTATTAEEAVACARRIGMPVALKVSSPDILHKSDVGGVLLNLADEAAVRAGFAAIVARARAAVPNARVLGVQVQPMISGGHEVIVGITRDPTLGPLVAFGLGGIYTEALADVGFRPAPLTASDAKEMVDEVRSSRLLAGLRGAPPADRAALIDTIVRTGWLAAHCPQIKELDINPLMVLPQGRGALAVDARVILAA